MISSVRLYTFLNELFIYSDNKLLALIFWPELINVWASLAIIYESLIKVFCKGRKLERTNSVLLDFVLLSSLIFLFIEWNFHQRVSFENSLDFSDNFSGKLPSQKIGMNIPIHGVYKLHQYIAVLFLSCDKLEKHKAYFYV